MNNLLSHYNLDTETASEIIDANGNTYHLEAAIPADQLTSLDLIAAGVDNPVAVAHTFRVLDADENEVFSGELIYLGGGAGIADNGDAFWTEACSPIEALFRYATGATGDLDQ